MSSAALTGCSRSGRSTLVVRAGLPGIDPAKDVEPTVSDGVLHIEAERREEEEREEKGYLRQEAKKIVISKS